MYQIKKKISFLLCITILFQGMILGAMPIDDSLPINLRDVSSSHWAFADIQLGLEQGYLWCEENGEFKPSESMTRIEFVETVNAFLGLSDKKEINFKDVEGSSKASEEIKKAVFAGYMEGKSKTTFEPESSITREEVATILARIVPIQEEIVKMNTEEYLKQTYQDYEQIKWSSEEVKTISYRGYMKGQPNKKFAPREKVTKAEIAKILRGIAENEQIVREDLLIETEEQLLALKNKIVVGDVTISEKIKKATLDESVILGNLKLESQDNFINNTIISHLIVDNPKITTYIEASKGSDVRDVTLNSKATLSVDANVGALEEVFKEVKDNYTDSSDKNKSHTDSASAGGSKSGSKDDSGDKPDNGSGDLGDSGSEDKPPVTTVSALAVPTDIKVNQNDNRYILTWNKVANAIGYTIQIEGGKLNQAINVSGVSQVTYDLTSLLEADITYTIKIKARGTGKYKDSPYSVAYQYTTSNVNPPTTPSALEAPTNIHMSQNNGRYILTWNRVLGSVGYNVHIVGGGLDKTVEIESKSQMSYDLTNLLVADTTYSITMQAKGDGITHDNSPYSAIYEYTLPPVGKPNVPVLTELALKDLDGRGNLDLRLTWSCTGNIAEFEVTIKEGSTSEVFKIDGIQRDMRLNQYMPKPNTKYEVSLKTVVGGALSESSNVLTYTTPNPVCGHNEVGAFLYQTGTTYKNYVVSTREEFEHINVHTTDVNTFFLMNDIDFEGKTYNKNIIDSFWGAFKGQGFQLDNFTIRHASDRVGIFTAVIQGSDIQNLGVGSHVTIENTSTNANHTGGIAAYGYGDFLNCYNKGTVKAKSGAVGSITGESFFTIQGCYNTGTITNTGSGATGGIVGKKTVSYIKDCYNTGAVQGGTGATGGIVGENATNAVTPIPSTYNSYNVGIVAGSGKTGSIIGYLGRGTKAGNNYYQNTGLNGIGLDEGELFGNAKQKVLVKTDSYMQSDAFVNELKFLGDNFIIKSGYDYPQLKENSHK